MKQKIIIAVTTICGIFCLVRGWFLISSGMTEKASNGSVHDSPQKGPRSVTLSTDTSKLGNISFHGSSVIAGNARGELLVFTTPYGTPPATFPLGKARIKARPLKDRDRFYVGNERGTLVASDEKGNILWSFSAEDRIAGGAILVENTLLFGSYDQKLYALTPDSGKVLYEVECESFINGSPVASTDGRHVFWGSCDGMLRKIDRTTGNLMGTIDLGSPIPESPALYKGILYAVTHEGLVVAVDTSTFEIIYKKASDGSFTSSPWVTDTALFLTTTDGSIVEHSRNDGSFRATVETTEKMTDLKAGNENRVYSVSRKGKLYSYDRSQTGWNRTLLTDYQTNCTQSCRLYDGKLFIADDSGGLYLYEVER